MPTKTDSIETMTAGPVSSKGRRFYIPALVAVLAIGGWNAHAAAQTSWRGLVVDSQATGSETGR